MIVLLFGFCVAVGVVLAYIMKLRLSGRRLGSWMFWGCVGYNVFFVSYYLRVVQSSYFLFIGYRPDWLEGNAVVGWLCVLGMALHSYAVPVQRQGSRR